MARTTVPDGSNNFLRFRSRLVALVTVHCSATRVSSVSEADFVLFEKLRTCTEFTLDHLERFSLIPLTESVHQRRRYYDGGKVTILTL